MIADGGVRALRERLVDARRRNDRGAVHGLIAGLNELSGRGYRCCLVDFEACRPAFYVRLLGVEDARVKAELEFPIDPHLRPLQRVPLSHLVDYDEAEPARIRTIYQSVAPYLHQRRPTLEAAAPQRAEAARDDTTPASAPCRSRLPQAGLWLRVAGLLFACSLIALVVT